MQQASIGEVSRRTGLKIPTIRFYEQSGLVAPPRHAENGRRTYSQTDERRLAFIQNARALGFSLSDVREFLALADHPDRPCGSAQDLVVRQKAAIDRRLAQLRSLRAELIRITDPTCTGSGLDCRILDSLAVQRPKQKLAPTVKAR